MTPHRFPLSFVHSDAGRAELLPAGASLLLLDSIHAPASFILLHFLAAALRKHRPVILLNLSQPAGYWTSLLQKQGIQPESAQYKHLLTTIDQLEQLEPSIKLQQSSPLVIIDDLSSIIWASERPADQLIDAFQAFLPAQLKSPFSLVSVFHQDLVHTNKRDREIFNHLINRYHIILRTRALGGQGRGELIIQRGPGYLSDLNLPITLSSEQTTQYKITDNSLSFYPKGLDKAFI
ncbi:hypothetical protein PTTG_07224 [Puccinia triticina 1-1 BBBD Race 1]|uniref:Elongator complex protein 5 n=2 Tax=Puccinia triticina TaxID=208348 RepID=A0A180GX22_PUCT1|nr:uncharacterized protein PtA15_9A701 [Puccinia triticina]OAV97345.1 hypothetical protein PTTG_07224 [Puccinia triticina 1-1 BBBD Race 1]WAQ88574.1 hypothetical protein PtA15_9A701 [Puccinia triticina]